MKFDFLHNWFRGRIEASGNGDKLNNIFKISDKEFEKYQEWYKEHKASGCKWTGYIGAIGGGLDIIFSPTSVGTGVTVRCGCGAEVDLTDISEW